MPPAADAVASVVAVIVALSFAVTATEPPLSVVERKIGGCAAMNVVGDDDAANRNTGRGLDIVAGRQKLRIRLLVPIIEIGIA